MKSLLKISGLVTFILTEYFICPFFLHFSQKKGVDEIYFINTIYYRAKIYIYEGINYLIQNACICIIFQLSFKT